AADCHCCGSEGGTVNPDGAATATPPTGDGWASAADRQAAARDAYRRSIGHGDPLTAAVLADRFDRSLRWAQERIAEIRNQRSTETDRRSVEQDGRRTTSDGRSTTGGERSTVEDGRSTTGRGLRTGGGRAGQEAQPSGAGQRFDTFIAVVVALVAAAASYEHQRSLAELAGEGALAWALPISVDGMMLATSRSILRRRRAGVTVPFLSWFGFGLGFAASVAANVAAAEPTLVGRLLAAWPPVALFITYETLAADHGEFRDR
ncbi:MAG: DUF2637 domain-containing protein, partial [Acidimicrobiales bacterium]